MLDGFFHSVDIAYIKGVNDYNFQIKFVLLSLRTVIVFANSVEPDKMLYDA